MVNQMLESSNVPDIEFNDSLCNCNIIIHSKIDCLPENESAYEAFQRVEQELLNQFESGEISSYAELSIMINKAHKKIVEDEN